MLALQLYEIHFIVNQNLKPMKELKNLRSLLCISLAAFTFACSEELDQVQPNALLAEASAQEAVKGMRREVTPVAAGITTDAVRHALSRFQNVELAEKAGYVRSGNCVTNDLGVMGIHWVNDKLRSDPGLNPMLPDMLVYVGDGNGGMRLVAVEYFVWEADWQNVHGADAPYPTMFGQTFIRGTHGIPAHYELHVWLWADNPRGMFANWNPAITCN